MSFSQALLTSTEVYVQLNEKRIISIHYQIIIRKSFNYSNVLALICTIDSSLMEPQIKYLDNASRSFENSLFQKPYQ